jgi:hypothetical protein
MPQQRPLLFHSWTSDCDKKRRRTYNEPGDAHEITFSCYRGFQYLRTERPRLWLAESINSARKELDFALWAFVFMPEHMHFCLSSQANSLDRRHSKGDQRTSGEKSDSIFEAACSASAASYHSATRQAN